MPTYELPSILLFVDVLLAMYIIAGQSGYWRCVSAIAYNVFAAVAAAGLLGGMYFWVGVFVSDAVLIALLEMDYRLVSKYGAEERTPATNRDDYHDSPVQ